MRSITREPPHQHASGNQTGGESAGERESRVLVDGPVEQPQTLDEVIFGVLEEQVQSAIIEVIGG